MRGEHVSRETTKGEGGKFDLLKSILRATFGPFCLVIPKNTINRLKTAPRAHFVCNTCSFK